VTSRLPPSEKGDVVRLLPGNFGYVDLTRLAPTEVDSMFEKAKDTRGLIFDMRGYPQGTAWSIAARINTRHAKTGAQFRRSQVGAFSAEEGQSGFYFSQPLPVLPAGKTLYTGATVMLIDDRAISQAEQSGLFFEAANGTRFIGTATAGANGDVTRFSAPGGLWIGFTGHDVRHADGRQLQRVGLVPDVEAAPTRAGLAGPMIVLLRAQRRSRIDARRAPGRPADGNERHDRNERDHAHDSEAIERRDAV
jgi:C-terminal processing protease CtpA/Prc